MTRTAHWTVMLMMSAASTTVACDPLTDGDWRGWPAMVVRGSTVALAPEPAARQPIVMLVWAPLAGEPPAQFTVQALDAVDVGLSDLELRLREPPSDAAFGAGDAAVAMMVIVAVDEWHSIPKTMDAVELAQRARAVSGEHYVIYQRGDGALDAETEKAILNPIAMGAGFNLAVGLCRPGRPSQLLVVQPERVALVAIDDPPAGGCLDVFWGSWRD